MGLVAVSIFSFQSMWPFVFQGDFVRDHLFNDLLKDSRTRCAYRSRPSFSFGKNIVEK